MQLRDKSLLLVILGLSNTRSHRDEDLSSRLYSRATSSEGLLCIRKYWDSHCSTFSKFPALAVLTPGSCPKGLAPALFVELFSRLTDLHQWQIWALWDTLDINSCGFVGCAEFTLLVVLLCAGVADQHLQAVHAYANSITRVFLGAHAGSSHAGLCQCCQIMGLPASAVSTALKQLHLQDQQQLLLQHLNKQVLPLQQQQQHQHQQQQSSSSLQTAAAQTCSSSGSASTNSTSRARRQQPSSRLARNSSNCCSTASGTQALQEDSTAGAAAACKQAAAGLGCCCQDKHSQHGQQQQQQQWACGAAAHRQHWASLDSPTEGPDEPNTSEPHGQQTAVLQGLRSAVCSQPTLMSVQDVELVLYYVAKECARLKQGAEELQPIENFSGGCTSFCTIC